VTLLDLPMTEHERLVTDDGFVLHRQQGAWLVWNEKLWPTGMSTFKGPRIRFFQSRDSGVEWEVQEQLYDNKWGEPGTFRTLDAAFEFAKKIVKAGYYDYNPKAKAPLQFVEVVQGRKRETVSSPTVPMRVVEP
jgi:hypothetical protein